MKSVKLEQFGEDSGGEDRAMTTDDAESLDNDKIASKSVFFVCFVWVRLTHSEHYRL